MIPAVEVPSPAWTPRPFGLFSVLTFTEGGETRWGTGVVFEQENCSTIGIYRLPHCEDVELDLDGNPVEFRRFDDEACRYTSTEDPAESFTVYGSSRGTPGPGASGTRAINDLIRKEQLAVEHAMWSGLSPTAYPLNAELVTTDTPADLYTAVALLETYAAAEFGGLGVIHVNPYHGALLAKDLVRNGQTLVTHTGTPVVVGGGYLNANDTPNTSLFITPPIVGYRGEIVSRQAFDRETNKAEAFAERDYLVAYDTCGVGEIRMADGPTTPPAYILRGE